MNKPRHRYVNAFTDRHGRQRVYFRYKGRSYPMPPVGTPEFYEEYARLLRTVAKLSAPNADPSPTSIEWLIKQYQASPEWSALADRTRKDYAAHLSYVVQNYGDRGYKKLSRRLVIGLLRDPLFRTPRRADAVVAALSAVYRWAYRRDMVTDNPCKDIGKLYRVGEGYRAWTSAEIATFIAKCTDWEWLVFCLGLYTTLRPGDLVKLTWFQYDGSRFTVRTSKTRKPLVITVHPVLKATLDALPMTEGTIITRPNGEPYTSASQLSNRWSSAMRRHGILGCTIHGLRTTGATALAEAGASDQQLMSVTGHKTRAMVGRYTRDAEQKRLNEASVAMLPSLERKR